MLLHWDNNFWGLRFCNQTKCLFPKIYMVVCETCKYFDTSLEARTFRSGGLCVCSDQVS
jgi:hypothetical protein